MKHHISVLGIDIAKRVFHVVGMDERGQIVLRKRVSRHDLIPFIVTLPPVLIGTEACGGAHYWARRFREHGHEVKLMAPQFVKPYIKSNKNAMRDAEGIGEAVTRPTMRFVPTKAVDQQDIQALHRVRERLIGARTALVNEIHGLLHEYGIVVPKGSCPSSLGLNTRGQPGARSRGKTAPPSAPAWRHSVLVHRNGALETGRADARRLLRLPPCAAFHPAAAHTPAGCGHGGTRYNKTSLKVQT